MTLPTSLNWRRCFVAFVSLAIGAGTCCDVVQAGPPTTESLTWYTPDRDFKPVDLAPVAVDAPMCIQSTVFRQKDAAGERLVVHLFNGTNTASDHGLPETAVPLREEVVPVGGIKVRFHKMTPKRVHLEPEGVELAPVQARRVDRGFGAAAGRAFAGCGRVLRCTGSTRAMIRAD